MYIVRCAQWETKQAPLPRGRNEQAWKSQASFDVRARWYPCGLFYPFLSCYGSAGRLPLE